MVVAVTTVVNTPSRLGWALLFVLVSAGESYAVIEHHGPIEGLWWALVTMSTVGYGDQYPATTTGRGIGAYLMVSSFLLVLCAGAQITARLVRNDNLLTDAEQREMQAATRYEIAMLEALCLQRGVSTSAVEDARAEYEKAAAKVLEEQK